MSITIATNPLPDPAEEMAYVGRKACGCVIFLSYDEPANRELCELNADCVAGIIREGGFVDRLPRKVVRGIGFSTCTHSPLPAARRTEGT